METAWKFPELCVVHLNSIPQNTVQFHGVREFSKSLYSKELNIIKKKNSPIPYTYPDFTHIWPVWPVSLSTRVRTELTTILKDVNKMTGRTIDESGKDVNERQLEPESIRTGWYWTGRYTVWVIGPTVHGRGVYYQTAGIGHNWAPMRGTVHWQRVHEQVKESGQGFGWRMPAQTH